MLHSWLSLFQSLFPAPWLIVYLFSNLHPLQTETTERYIICGYNNKALGVSLMPHTFNKTVNNAQNVLLFIFWLRDILQIKWLFEISKLTSRNQRIFKKYKKNMSYVFFVLGYFTQNYYFRSIHLLENSIMYFLIS